MIKLFKKIVATGCVFIAIFAMICGVQNLSVKAEVLSGSSLSEQELYNATNTYNVDESYFVDGVFQPTTDPDRKDSTAQYRITYDTSETNELADQVMDVTQITVLTHGLDSGAFAWSNNYTGGSFDGAFASDDQSLISMISNAVGGANIYWAIMDDYDTFNLFDITDQTIEDNELTNGEIYDDSDENQVAGITDISKHIIIVFEAYESRESNDNIYYQFNYMMSKIVYDVKNLNGGFLPKVNLIGHSRGGITNLQYALDHPDLVSTLVSLATPYFGSTTARLFGEMQMGECDGLDDVVDAELYYSYNTRWNNNYDRLYKNIDAYAYGSYHTLFSLSLLVMYDQSEQFSVGETMGISMALTTLNVIKLWDMPGDSLLRAALTNVWDYFFPSSKIVDAVEILYKEIQFDKYPMYVSFYNDVLVPLDSQLAIDTGTNAYGGGSYLGFQNWTRPYIGSINEDYTRVSEANVPVGHNLIARDTAVLGRIVCNLDLGVDATNAYMTYENEDGTLTFVGYRGEYMQENFVLPQTIDGKTVTAIETFAFRDMTGVETVELPSTIQRIGEYAFFGMSDLQRVTIASSSALERIGEGAFFNCEALTQFGGSANVINIPLQVKKVGKQAFFGTAAGNVNFYGSVEQIHSGAFGNMPNLTAIQASGNTAFVTVDGNLYNTNGKLLQYAAGKTATSFAFPETVAGKAIMNIGDFAFAGAEDVQTVSLDGIEVIGNYAFLDCTGLSALNDDESVLYIGENAFGNTALPYFSADFFTVGHVLYRYNGDAEIIEESDFPSAVTRISQYAFCEVENLQEVYLPLKINFIEDYAFFKCDNLQKIRYRNTELPYINSKPFVDLHEDFKLYCRKSIIDALEFGDPWLYYFNQLKPIETQVYFEDLRTTATFYYGSPIEIPDLYLSESLWEYYDESLTCQSDDIITTFKLTLKPNNGQENTIIEFDYQSEILLPIPEKEGYKFDGWIDGEGTEWTIVKERVGNLELEAQWSQLYTVTLFSRMHTIYSKSYTGTLGQDIRLDTLINERYEVYYWGEYLPGSIYIITGDITLEAEWGYRRFSLNLYDSKNGAITYLETKTVTYNQSYNLGKRIPTSYNVFLGWYDKSTRNAADDLPQQKRYTDVNGASLAPWTDVSKSSFDLIAEYRSKAVDLFWDHSRTDTYLITDSGRFYQACDTFNIREQCGYSASELYALGYRTIYMTVKLNIWEVNDGYQYVFIYDGTGNNANLLGRIELEHGGTTKNTSSKRYAINFYVPITEDSTDIICVRYGAAGNYEDDWKNSELSLFVNACTDVMNNDPSYSIEPNV